MSHQLSKSQTRLLFEHVSKELVQKSAEVQVAPLRLGDQIDGKWLPLLGLSYDTSKDAMIIVREGVDITIPNPREVHFDGTDGQFDALDIRDQEGVQHVVRLKEPMKLPAAL